MEQQLGFCSHWYSWVSGTLVLGMLQRLLRKLWLDGRGEASDGGGFVGLHIEDGVKPRNLNQIPHVLIQLNELQLAARVLNCRMGAHKFTEPCAIDIIHLTQIQKDLAISLCDQFAHHLSQGCRTWAKGNRAAEIDYGDFTHLAKCSLQRHG